MKLPELKRLNPVPQKVMISRSGYEAETVFRGTYDECRQFIKKEYLFKDLLILLKNLDVIIWGSYFAFLTKGYFIYIIRDWDKEWATIGESNRVEKT